MRKQKKQTKKRKGAALLVAILLSAIIGSAAIGVTSLAFRQVNTAETYNNGLAAYYAAESGLEQSLLYYKFDKDTEIPKTINATLSPDPAGLLRRPTFAYRNFLDQNPMQQPIDTTGVKIGYSVSDRVQVYDLQTFYKQAFVGDDVSDPKGVINGVDLANYPASTLYKIDKDNDMTFTINSNPADQNDNSARDIHLYWKWIKNNAPLDCNSRSRALEVKVKVKIANTLAGQNEFTSLLQDPRCPAITNADTPDAVAGTVGVFTPQNGASLQVKMGISSLTVTEMTLKPVGNTASSGDGIYFGFSQGAAGKRYSSGLTTTVQSIGYFGGNSRQITANIDRQTGTILDIFNYVLFKGGP